MPISTVGDLMGALRKFGPSTPITVLLRTPLEPGSEQEIRPMRVCGRTASGVDIICTGGQKLKMPVEDGGWVNADHADRGDEAPAKTSKRRGSTKRGSLR